MIPWIILLNSVAAVGRFHLTLLGVWALIHTVTLTVAGLPVLLARAVMLRRGVTDVGVSTVVIAGFVIGATKGSLTGLAEATLGLSDDWATTVWVRIIGASFAAVWLLLLTAYARTGLEQLERSRAELVRQNVATRLATEAHSSRTELRKPLEQLTQLRDDVVSGRRPASADTLRSVVDDTIRPIAKALWSVEDARYPRITLRALFRLSLESAPPPGLAIVLIWAPLSFTALTGQMGIVPNLGYTFATAALTVIAWPLLRTVISRMIPIAMVIISLFSLAVVTAGSLLASQVITELFQTLTPVIVVFGALWMTFVVIGVSIVSGALAISQLISRDLASNEAQALVGSQSDSVFTKISSRQVATVLHGEVQSRLLGLAAAIEQNRLDPREIVTRLDSAVEALRRLDDSRGHISGIGLRGPADHQIAEVVDAWRGLVQIVLDDFSHRALCTLIDTAPEMTELIREAITNAHRHGNATRVAITVNHDRNNAIVRVTDNGYGPREGNPGLGTALLDRFAPGSWSLTRVQPPGSQLEIRLPFSLQHA